MTTLNPKAAAWALAAICGGSVLLVGLINLSDAAYGRELLELLASVYPGYTPDRTIESVMILTGYGLFDGALKGWLFAWLYNRALKNRDKGQETRDK
jgi:hypothetical protein